MEAEGAPSGNSPRIRRPCLALRLAAATIRTYPPSERALGRGCCGGRPDRECCVVRRNSIEIQPIAGAVGAEIHGVDLSQELGSETVATIRRALLDHLVIFFRDQDLTPAQFLAFAQCFGTPVEYPFVKGIDGFPEITEVIKREHEHHNFGGVWHSDTDYLR